MDHGASRLEAPPGPAGRPATQRVAGPKTIRTSSRQWANPDPTARGNRNVRNGR